MFYSEDKFIKKEKKLWMNPYFIFNKNNQKVLYFKTDVLHVEFSAHISRISQVFHIDVVTT